ncbi:amidohydrolase [Sphingomonas qilianensis]|uniref:Amidohydrolase n=1 Tax=Sphingomonas qilianensis TaxID=1736690 RepID=A0ABU9XTJ3_9SPHN
MGLAYSGVTSGLRQTAWRALALCIGLLITAPASAEAPSAALVGKVNAAIDADTDRLVAVFKDLHQHPEIGFTETRTAAIVTRELKGLGFAVTTGIGKTLWFRADMDAIAVRESTGLAYAATKPQSLPDGRESEVMHACGHDAHITWLLGLAKAMVALKSAWTGTLVVYAQPAEELGLGAQAMIDDGLLTRGFPKPDFGLSSHTAPGPVGYVSNSAGVRMAGMDQLDISFTGLGGHGSAPELTIDPVVMAAQAVPSYQTIISRNVDPQSAAVLTVGAIQAGTGNNVIPQTAKLLINLRCFKPDVRALMIKRIDEVSRGVAIAAGVPEGKLPVRTMKGGAGPLINDPALVDTVNPALTALLGTDKVVNNFPAVMGSEDYQEVMDAARVPYVFLLIGVAPVDQFKAALAAGRSAPYSNHNPDFFVDLAAIPIGAKADTIAALSLLAK